MTHNAGTTDTIADAGSEQSVELVFQLGYSSAAARPFDAGELVELLTKARENNAALGVTGMLLYHDGSFLQVLEGERQTVEALYDKIADDPRHLKPMLLFRHEDHPRSFGEWTMGFHELLRGGIEPPAGLNRFLQTGAAGLKAEDGERIYDVLLGFRDGRWRRVVSS